MTQDRPTAHLIKTGNYFADGVNNIVEILEREQREDTEQKLTYLNGVLKIHDEDILLIPKTPCIAVSFEGFEEIIHTIGKRQVTVETTLLINTYYYHQEISREIRKKEIRDAMWELARILRRNSDLNGLSSKGAQIPSGEVMSRLRQNGAFSGGLIRMQVPILHQSRRGVS